MSRSSVILFPPVSRLRARHLNRETTGPPAQRAVKPCTSPVEEAFRLMRRWEGYGRRTWTTRPE